MHLPYDRDRHTLIFLHIQKTAGSSLGRIIYRQYPHDRTYVLRGDDEEIGRFLRLPEAQRARVQMLRGVTYYGIHKAFPGESRYFTMLRDPVDRVVSNYMFLQRKARQGSARKGRPIEQWLEQHPAQFNMQVRMLIGGESRAHTLSRPLPDDAVEQAKANIRAHFSLVGLTERFDESLLLMGQRFGWTRLHYVKKLVSPKEQREKITAAQRAWIAGHCGPDLALYQWAKAEFEATVAAQPPGFADALAALRQASARHSRLYNATAGLRASAPYHWLRRTLWPAWAPWGTPEDD